MGVLSRWIGVATLAAATAVSTAPVVRAADMPMAPPLEPVEEGPVTFGTGWYLRGDLGLAQEKQILVDGALLPQRATLPNSFVFGLGAGYKYNSWFRSDLTFEARQTQSFNGFAVTGPGCWYVLNAASCPYFTNVRMNSYQILGNVYVDLGTWAGLTPYVGVGAGMNFNRQKIVTSPILTNILTSTTTSFAWAAMAGVSYAFTPNVAVDVGFRYLNFGSIPRLSALGMLWARNLDSKEIRIGFRYTPD